MGLPAEVKPPWKDRLAPWLPPRDKWDWGLPVALVFIIVLALILAGIFWSLDH